MVWDKLALRFSHHMIIVAAGIDGSVRLLREEVEMIRDYMRMSCFLKVF